MVGAGLFVCVQGAGLLSAPPHSDGQSVNIFCPPRPPVPQLLTLDCFVTEQNFEWVQTLMLLA